MADTNRDDVNHPASEEAADTNTIEPDGVASGSQQGETPMQTAECTEDELPLPDAKAGLLEGNQSLSEANDIHHEKQPVPDDGWGTDLSSRQLTETASVSGPAADELKDPADTIVIKSEVSEKSTESLIRSTDTLDASPQGGGDSSAPITEEDAEREAESPHDEAMNVEEQDEAMNVEDEAEEEEEQGEAQEEEEEEEDVTEADDLDEVIEYVNEDFRGLLKTILSTKGLEASNLGRMSRAVIMADLGGRTMVPRRSQRLAKYTDSEGEDDTQVGEDSLVSPLIPNDTYTCKFVVL